MTARLRAWWQKNKRLLITFTAVVMVVIIVFSLAVSWFGWDWTGFSGGYSQITTTSTSHGITTTTVKPSGKTLWDWLQILFVPIVLAIGGFWLNQIQKSREEKTTEQRVENEKKAADERAKIDHEIASDNQQEAALQAYIDSMSELLLHENLRNSTEKDEVRKIARVRTLTVLRRLDADRKRSVLLFLYESGLLDRHKRIIDLRSVGLRAVDRDAHERDDWALREAGLYAADLSEADVGAANLREVILRGAYLQLIDLSGSDLRGADLSRADLSKADLGATILRDANLRDANFCKADLSQVDLRGADLRGANLGGADLGGADLRFAQVTEVALDQAESLKGALMPDGSKHP